jgi:hypothetical protein
MSNVKSNALSVLFSKEITVGRATSFDSGEASMPKLTAEEITKVLGRAAGLAIGGQRN